MGHTLKRWVRGAALLPAVALTGALAYAQEAPDLEARIAALEDSATASAYIDNSYLFLLMGMVVMFMAAGFCMLEVGLVRAKNASMQAMKNVAIYALAGLVTWLCGYHMIYPADGHWLVENWVSMPVIWSHGALETDNGGYAAGSDWFFQMVFVATAASIVSGTVAERVEQLLTQQINPALAAHGGFASLVEVRDESIAVVTMGGGCQGCAVSAVTLREGIQKAILEHIPEITEVVDSTDHDAGENPFYT